MVSCSGSTAGMYTPADFEVSERLRYGQENLLVVVIDPAPAGAAADWMYQPGVHAESAHELLVGFLPADGPLGIWQEVYLKQAGRCGSRTPLCVRTVANDLSRAVISIAIVTFHRNPRTDVQVETVLRYKEQVVASRRSGTDSGRIDFPSASLEVDSAAPVVAERSRAAEHLHGGGPGRAGIWRLREGSWLAAPDQVSDTRRVPFGIRRVEFVPNEGRGGRRPPYTLVVNGRIYIKGWNWVPMDALYGVERPEKPARLLTWPGART